VPHGHQAGLLQLADRFAHGVAVGAVGFGELALSREAVSGRELAPDDGALQVLEQDLGQA